MFDMQCSICNLVVHRVASPTLNRPLLYMRPRGKARSCLRFALPSTVLVLCMHSRLRQPELCVLNLRTVCASARSTKTSPRQSPATRALNCLRRQHNTTAMWLLSYCPREFTDCRTTIYHSNSIHMCHAKTTISLHLLRQSPLFIHKSPRQ